MAKALRLVADKGQESQDRIAKMQLAGPNRVVLEDAAKLAMIKTKHV